MLFTFTAKSRPKPDYIYKFRAFESTSSDVSVARDHPMYLAIIGILAVSRFAVILKQSVCMIKPMKSTGTCDEMVACGHELINARNKST